MQCTRPIPVYELNVEKIYHDLLQRNNLKLTEEEMDKVGWNTWNAYLYKAWEIYNTKILSDKGNWIYKYKHISFTPTKIKEKFDWYDLNHLPCGQCPACRINHSNEIATVATMESMQWQNNCAITCTYDNQHLPKNRSLKKEDMQDFWKRLYSYIEYHCEIDNREIWENPITHKVYQPQRKIYSGEYGPTTKRPHYHACIFNWAPNWDKSKFYGMSKSGFPIFTYEPLTKCWGNGLITVQPFSTETAAYCARYTSKKILEDRQEEKLKKGQEKPFIERSRNGALGIKFWYDNQETFKKENKIIYGNEEKPIPKYFKKRWQKDNPFEYWQMNHNRPKLEDWFSEKETDLTVYQYLQQIEESNFITMNYNLPRNNL